MKITGTGAVAAVLLAVLASTLLAFDNTAGTSISNSVLQAKVALPDFKSGYYRGTRFDGSGIILSLLFKGHDYYGPWFTKTSPTVRDFVYEGADIVAGPCSAITGPVEEYGPLGWDSSEPGGTFVKIGIGALRKPQEDRYDHYRVYEIADPGKWTVGSHRDSIQFVHTLNDTQSGYGYVYQKTIRLVKGGSELILEHTLKNTGTRVIDTTVYNHNFLVLDRQPTSQDFKLTFPFEVHSAKPPNPQLAEIRGHDVVYLKTLKDQEVASAKLEGFGTDAKDNAFQIENSRLGVGIKMTADQPLSSLALWSIRSVIAVEPFITIAIEPKAEFRWTNKYTYYALPSGDATNK
jgi:hypothetical protein